MTGDAPCSQCGYHIWNVQLNESSKEPSREGGHCPNCGEPMRYLHEPKLVEFDWFTMIVETPEGAERG